MGQVPGHTHAPRLHQLKQLGAERVREAVVNGRMRPNARFMSKADIDAVIAFLAAPEPPSATAAQEPPASAASASK